ATTYYFRNRFQFADDPTRAELKLDFAMNDGAIFYLNGVEVYHYNMPVGAVNYSTLAVSAVGDALLVAGIALPATNLVQGVNVLAVEVHQAAAVDSGMVFGAALTVHLLPLDATAFASGDLVFNEVSAANAVPFQIELFNRGAQ